MNDAVSAITGLLLVDGDPSSASNNLTMNTTLHSVPALPSASLDRRQFLRTAGQGASVLTAASVFAPAVLSAPAPARILGVGCIGVGTRGGDLLNAVVHVPDTWGATYEFEKLGRTVTFEGSMNATDRQPVTLCGRDATLRFDAIAHDVSTFEVVPAGHHQHAALPEGYQRGQTPSQPNHIVDWVNCIRTRGTPKCSTDEAFIETATFLMSLKAQQERRMVRWDPVREDIV